MTATSSAPTLTILQAFRAVTRQEASTPTAPQTSTTAAINIKSRFDPRLGQQIILWNDIVKVFKGAEYVQHAGTLVPNLVNDDFEDLIPLRIAAQSGVVLEVVISNPRDTFLSEADTSSSSIATLSVNEFSQDTTIQLRPASIEAPIPSHPPPSYEQSAAAAHPQDEADMSFISTIQHLPSVSSSVTNSHRFQLFAPRLEDTQVNNNASVSTMGVAQHRAFVVVGNRLSTDFTSPAQLPPSSSPSTFSPSSSPRVRSRRSLPAAPSRGSTACDLDSILTSFRFAHPPPPSTRTSQGREQGYLQTLFNTAPSSDQELTDEIGANIDSFLRTTRTLYWHEAPTPRLFIVLPMTCYSTDRPEPVLDKFRFFWMCEFTHQHCSGDSQSESTPRGAQGQLPHLYHRGSWEVVRPREFFAKYGDHLLQTLLMVKYGGGGYGEHQDTYLSLRNQTGPDHISGIQLLKDESGLSQYDVELHLDLMIRHLQHLLTTTNDSNGNVVSEEGTAMPLQRKALAPLQYNDLTQLPSFLIQRRTSTVHSTTTDASAPVHLQYRVVNKQGYVHWICRSHMNILHPTFNPEQIQPFVFGQYDYSSQNGELKILGRSNIPLSLSHSINIVKTTCVSEMIIDVQSGMSASEFYRLRDAVLVFALSSLDIRNLGFIAPTAAERRPTSTLIPDTNATRGSSSSRGDPCRLLQSFSNTLWQLLNDHPLQSLNLRNANHLLTQDWARKPIHPFRLRRISLTISTKGKGLVPIRQGILNIVSNSPHLQDLKIDWDDLEEAVGEEYLLNTLVARDVVNPTVPIRVCLVMSDRSTSLEIKDGLFVDVSLTALSLPSLTQQFLAQSGRLNRGRLTITSMAVWGLTSPYIKMFLSKNPGLTSLDLQYPLEDFAKIEQFIVHTLLYPTPGYGHCSSISRKAHVGYQLREFTLRDTRGRNDICARYTLPDHSSSHLLERYSVNMLVDMVLVEKTDTDYHSFFRMYGHAVKSLVLTQDTASTILSAFDKATANSTYSNGKLQLTNIVVSLKGLNIASTFHLHNILQRSKGTFKQLTLCGDIPLRSHFETETLLNLLPAFVGEQVVLLRETHGTRMQEWEDLVRRLLPEGAVLILAEDRWGLCLLVPGLSLSIAEHL